MDDELDLGKYAAAIRRRRWVIVAAALLGVLAGLVVGLRSPLSVTRSLVPLNRSAELQSAGVSPANVNIGSILTRVAATLSSDSFDSEVESDSSVTARAVITEDLMSIVFEASAPTASESDRLLETAVGAATRQYAHEFRLVLDPLEVNFQASLEERRSALASIEQQLDAARSDQTTLSEGLLVAAQAAREAIVRGQGEIAALQRLSAGLDGDLRLLDSDDTARSRSLFILAVFGGLGAGLVVGGGVILMAALDRRIRTRRNLDRIGLTNLLGVLSRRETDTELDVLAGALRQAATRASATMIQLVPVSESAFASLAEQLTPRLHPLAIHDRPPIGVDAVETMQHAPDALTVMVVAWGKDNATQSMSTANRLAAATNAPIGVVLVAVPVAEIELVER